MTAVGGFQGYKRGADESGDTLVLVRGEPASDYAVVIVQRDRDSAEAIQNRRADREAYAYVHLGLQVDALVRDGWVQDERLRPDSQWIVHGVPFFYATLHGTADEAGRHLGFVFATVHDDLVSFELQSPDSLWPVAFAGLEALVASLRLAEAP